MAKNKHFIITIDTEGDNLWDWKPDRPILTQNVAYLPRFQELCEFYGFKPVWLSNYEMMSDPRFVEFAADVESRHAGEIGMHLHAWNSPPEHQLPFSSNDAGAPYLIEYPSSVMEEKIAVLTELITGQIGIRPTTHRAGRWATNDIYYDLLKKYGYQVDCSVTPHVSWTGHAGQTPGSCGSDYSHHSEEPYWLDHNKTLLEVPVTIRRSHKLFLPEQSILREHGLLSSKYLRRLAGNTKRALIGNTIWLRPHHSSEAEMHSLLRTVSASDSDYIMFMLHSSELMPGGSPNFPTEESIERLYSGLERLFAIAAKDYSGITLRDYYTERQSK